MIEVYLEISYKAYLQNDIIGTHFHNMSLYFILQIYILTPHNKIHNLQLHNLVTYTEISSIEIRKKNIKHNISLAKEIFACSDTDNSEQGKVIPLGVKPLKCCLFTLASH